MTRVLFADVSAEPIIQKTQQQLAKEAEEFEGYFKGSQMTETEDEMVKNAIKEDDFQIMLAKKKQAKDGGIGLSVQPATSLKFGVIGSGHAGSKIAEVLFKFGYPTICLNSARQDLELIDIPADNKLHMNYSIGGGGSGKTLEVGRAAIEDSAESVRGFISEKLPAVDVYLATFSLGGGSGSGSAETLINILTEFQKPIIVLCALPGGFDDTQSKFNAVQTLARLGEQSNAGQISSLILIDNAQLEKQFVGLAQSEFWKTSNLAVVEPLHLFNSLSASPTTHEALDSADFSVALLESGGCTIFGSNKVTKEQYANNDLALVEAIVDNLEHGLMAEGFVLKDAQKVGILIRANKRTLASIPYANISFIFKYISEEFASAASFKGIYEIESESDDITIHFMFSGMGLPRNRIESLKDDAKKSMDVLASKKVGVAGKMSIDTGHGNSSGAANSMMSQIKKNKSALGKLIGSTSGSNKSLTDRRR